jgi:peptide/nickel transport system substrate-binding protein
MHCRAVRSAAVHVVACGRMGWAYNTLAVSGLALLLACTDAKVRNASAPAIVDAQPIEVLVPSEIDTFDPRITSDAYAVRLSRLVHAGLMRLDPVTLEPKPDVALSYTWESPLRLLVQLRPGVYFPNGHEVAADDVVATLASFARDSSRQRRVVEAISHAEVVAARTVRIVLREPHATLLSDLELPIMQRSDAERDPRQAGYPLGSPGLGPFVIASVEPGVVQLAPRSGGSLPLPKHAVVFRTIRDENARAMRMLSGRADIASSVFSPSTLRALESAGLTLRERPGSNTAYVLIRHQGLLASKDVRAALALSLDREALTKGLLAGRADAASSLTPPSFWSYRTPDRPLLRDVPEARRLLAAARLVTGGEAREGPVRVSLLTSTDRVRGSVARLVASQAAEAGFLLEPATLELGTLLARLSSGAFELAILQIPEFTEPNLLKTFLHRDLAPPRGLNRGRYDNGPLSELLDQGEQALEPNERLRIYAQVEQHIASDWPLIPLWHERQTVVLSARARAFLPSSEGRLLALAAIP